MVARRSRESGRALRRMPARAGDVARVLFAALDGRSDSTGATNSLTRPVSISARNSQENSISKEKKARACKHDWMIAHCKPLSRCNPVCTACVQRHDVEKAPWGCDQTRALHQARRRQSGGKRKKKGSTYGRPIVAALTIWTEREATGWSCLEEKSMGDGVGDGLLASRCVMKRESWSVGP